MILEKALTWIWNTSRSDSRHSRAHGGSFARPLSLVQRSFALAQNIVSLVSFGVLLWNFSPWAVALLLLAGLPGFVAEARFSNEAYQLFRWRSSERRMQAYLETVIAREDHAKEVKLYALGRRLLDRYQAIHKRLFAQQRKLAIRRDSWGFGLGLLATSALYAGYCWVAVSAVRGAITIGEMTMYCAVYARDRCSQPAAGAIMAIRRQPSLSTLYEYATHTAHPGGVRQRSRRPRIAAGAGGITFPAPSIRLDGIALHRSPSHLALVGANGSGNHDDQLEGIYVTTPGVIRPTARLAEWDVEACVDVRHLPGLCALPAHGGREHRRWR